MQCGPGSFSLDHPIAVIGFALDCINCRSVVEVSYLKVQSMEIVLCPQINQMYFIIVLID